MAEVGPNQVTTLSWDGNEAQGYSSDRTTLTVHECATAPGRCALSEVGWRVPIVVWFRSGLPGLPGLVALAGWLRLSSVCSSWRLESRRRPPQVRSVWGSDVSHGGDDVRPPQDSADGVVRGMLGVRFRQGRHVRVESAAVLGDRLVSDRVGDAASAALSAGAPGRDRLIGTVEVDETYIGGEEPGLRGGRAKGKKVLVGIAVEVQEPRGFGRVRMAILADGSASSLHSFVTEHVEPGARVITDGWAGYRGIDKFGYTYEPRSQRAARARGQDPGELLPGVHRVASLVKRWLLGTHQGSVDKAHLQSYLEEFVFRFNRRRSRSRGMVFYRVLELAVAHAPVRYRDLVADPQPKQTPPSPPGRRGHPPTMDRPRAARPWRAS